MRVSSLVLALTASLLLVSSARGQSIGQFSWQLQPYCNVVTVNVTQNGGVYTLDGFDTQCGAPQRAPVTGLATPNPDGTIGFGFTVVASPAGTPVHVAARISLATLSGTWNDSGGASGAFAFAANTGGAPRPAAALAGAQLVPGSIGVAQVNTAQVQARITGLCPAGQFAIRVNADGSLDCDVPVAPSPVTHAFATYTASIPSGSTSPGNAVTFATLPVTVADAGFIVFRARGTCYLTSLTSGPASVVLGLFTPGQTSFSPPETASIAVPLENPAGDHRLGYDAERIVPMTAGSTVQMSFRGYHAAGPTAPFQCIGSFTALFVPGKLP